LARLSVVRATGVPLMDDWVVNGEPVIDFLTEFSGVSPSDLDLATSRKPLVSHKHVYKKLRFLLECGVVFVGHGLKSDFRTMNILVPPAQVLDTVDLYYIPARQRRLSLKFLMWAVKGMGIQRDAHDSVEDAQAALLLYQHYAKHKAAGTWDQELEEVYAKGRQVNFRVPPVPSSGRVVG
jgi:PAB-dependent poly(A)-specific ribonuclease subunit 2